MTERVLVAMSGGLLGIIMLRRLEGVSHAAARWGWPLAIWRRVLFDADVPPLPHPGALERREEA